MEQNKIEGFELYKEQYKSLLVSWYHWMVKDAYHVDTEPLRKYYDMGVGVQYAYFKINNIPQDIFNWEVTDEVLIEETMFSDYLLHQTT